ncbi:hypothetical protein BDZ91DRAFT_851826 [Kalaharituber pfeilii]|nr:hypothetical protein BDZ91DRAFT_851826 [Kalaharituber pfeilii]
MYVCSPPPTYSDAITYANLTYLHRIFKRLPKARKAIEKATGASFFAPTPEAFEESGFDPCISTDEELQSFLDDHTILNKFLAYTPSLEEGQEYSTVGGKKFKADFNGTHTFLDKAVVVGEDHIIENGVIQVIDEVCSLPGFSSKIATVKLTPDYMFFPTFSEKVPGLTATNACS